MAFDHAWILAAALAADAVVGDPPALWRRMSHPAALVGSAVAFADRRLNRPSLGPAARKAWGAFAVLTIVAAAAATGALLEGWLAHLPFGWAGIAIVAAILLAARSLHDHVAAVAAAFDNGGLTVARKAVAHIVGRDPESLNSPGVCRAAIESAAENFSDAVVAPAFWFLLLGLPGMLAYKAINTADSMIGHRTPRHADFGWAAARLDDLANLAPARIAGGLIALAAPLGGGAPRHAFGVMLHDARLHRSPNAGWPEAAMAGALGLALAGPRRYGRATVDDRFLNAAGRHMASPADIRRALQVYRGAWAALAVAVVVLGVILG